MLILTKSVFVIMIGFLSSVLLGLILIPIMNRLKAKQNISVFMLDKHKKKQGTPTMGGFIFIIPTLFAILILSLLGKIKYTDNLGILLVVFIGYAIIGFLDDYLSIKRKNNEGLTTYQKLFGQIIIALIFFFLYLKNNGQTAIVVTTLGINIELGWAYGLFILFLLVGFSNAVNLTDGLDGLAGGLSAIAFIAFGLISMATSSIDTGIFTFMLVGSLFGFLVFNSYPAKIIMGDTGSLALGGVMAALSIITHREITLLVVSSVFIIETLSVIIQTVWIMLFKKKLFLMTPIHHHFEKLGWLEQDIVRMFWVFGLVFAMSGIFFAVWL